MSLDIRDYDLATLYRFKLFYNNTHWYNKPNLPITEIRNEHIYEGKRIEFPLLAIRRVSAPLMYKDGQNNWAAGRTGDQRGRDISIAPDGTHTSVDMTMVQTNYELRYMIDVFSLERDNFDELVVELQENIFRYPYLTFENWKNKELDMLDPQVPGMSTNIIWESTEDNTDLESFDSQTPFYRATITFTVRAYIYRKYTALLVEDVINGYRILDYNKETQQIVESSVSGLPLTEEELTKMLESGKAFPVSQEDFVVDLSGLSENVLATLPSNLAGIVTVVIGDKDSKEIVPVSYTTEGEGDSLVITIYSSFDGDNLTLVLKNIVEDGG